MPQLIYDAVDWLLKRNPRDLAPAAVGGAIMGALWLYIWWHGKAGRRTQDELRKTNGEAKIEKHKAIFELEHTKQQLEKTANLQTAHDKIQDRLESAETARQELESELHEQQQQNAEIEQQNAELKEDVDKLERQFESVINSDGKVWQKPPANNRPEFRSCASGRPPIIATVNLKGGVGKTTITANLGAAFWNSGKRVLLVDLDYQGSLSSLCLSAAQLHDIRRTNSYVDRLLESESPNGSDVLKLACRIQDTDGFLLAADEATGDVEMKAMAQWIVGREEGDVRYRLRSALHSEEVGAEYDLILLDCPPRLTTACINALCCCDGVLIPVKPDPVSTAAVPRLLQHIRSLKVNDGVAPDLEVLGILANEVHNRSGMSTRQRQLWNDLKDACNDRWHADVHMFETTVPQSVAFPTAAEQNTFAAADAMESVFRDLRLEISERIRIHANP